MDFENVLAVTATGFAIGEFGEWDFGTDCTKGNTGVVFNSIYDPWTVRYAKRCLYCNNPWKEGSTGKCLSCGSGDYKYG